MEKAIFVDIADITGAKIFFVAHFDESLGSLFGFAQISLHHGKAANNDFTVLADGDFFAGFGVHNDDFIIGDGEADAVWVSSDAARRENKTTRSLGEAVAVFHDGFGAMFFKKIIDDFFR